MEEGVSRFTQVPFEAPFVLSGVFPFLSFFCFISQASLLCHAMPCQSVSRLVTVARQGIESEA